MNIQFTLAARYLFGRKLRTFLTTLAITFGVLVLFGMNIVLPSMLEALQVNALAGEGQVDVTITHVTGGAFDAKTFQLARGVEGVRAAAPFLNRTVNLPTNFYDQDPTQPDRVIALALSGIVPYDAKSVRSFPVVTGRYLEETDRDAAIISQSLADVIGIKVGERFSIPTINGVIELTAVGILPARLAPGNEEVFVTLSQAQEMTGEPGMINVIDVNLKIPESEQEANAGRQEILSNLEAALGPDYKIGSLLTGSEMFASLQMG